MQIRHTTKDGLTSQAFVHLDTVESMDAATGGGKLLTIGYDDVERQKTSIHFDVGETNRIAQAACDPHRLPRDKADRCELLAAAKRVESELLDVDMEVPDYLTDAIKRVESELLDEEAERLNTVDRTLDALDNANADIRDLEADVVRHRRVLREARRELRDKGIVASPALTAIDGLLGAQLQTA